MANGLQSTEQATGFAWSSGSISPPPIQLNPAFVTPEQVVASSTPRETREFSVNDFLVGDGATRPNDPKLASRPFGSAPINVPGFQKGVGVSAYQSGNVPLPAFLTESVNRLNATQSLRSQQQEGFRQQLLDAVLGGNYLAAEALRAQSVSPGSSVSFGAAVQDPIVGQSQLIASKAAAEESAVRTEALGAPLQQASILQMQLQKVNGQLGRLAGGSSIASSAGFGQDRANLQSEQFRIKRELERQQQLSSGFVPNINFKSSL